MVHFPLYLLTIPFILTPPLLKDAKERSEEVCFAYKQGKNVFKATGFRCCHCFPCTMLPGLKRAKWSPEAGETVLSV